MSSSSKQRHLDGDARSRDHRHEARGRDLARLRCRPGKAFYQSLGWRLDADIVRGDAFRVVQFTPPHSACSIAFGKGLTTGEPGSVQRLILAVADIDAARADLISRGVEVSELFHLDGGRVPGRTRKAAPTRPTPRSATPTATGGCSRRSRRGSPAGSGRTDDGHRRPARPAPRDGRASRPLTRRPTPRTTGGTGTPPTSTPASTAARRTTPRRPRAATWRKSCT